MLQSHGIAAWRINNMGVHMGNGEYRQAPHLGISDILGVLPSGQFLAIEVKSRKGIVSPEQKVFLETIEKNNGLAIIARHPNEVFVLLKERGFIP